MIADIGFAFGLLAYMSACLGVFLSIVYAVACAIVGLFKRLRYGRIT